MPNDPLTLSAGFFVSGWDVVISPADGLPVSNIWASIVHMFLMRQSGISLYTLLAAVVVLGLLGSVSITLYTGDKTRAAAAVDLLRSVNQAAQRFHLDTGCYPTNILALQRQPSTSSETTCNQPIAQSRWHGPYTTVFGPPTARLGWKTRCGQHISRYGPHAAVCLNGRGEPYLYNLLNAVSDDVYKKCGDAACRQQGRGSGVLANVVFLRP